MLTVCQASFIIAKNWAQAAAMTNKCQLKCANGFLNAYGIVPIVYNTPPANNSQITVGLTKCILGIKNRPNQPNPIYNITPVFFIFLGKTRVVVTTIPMTASNQTAVSNKPSAQPLYK